MWTGDYNKQRFNDLNRTRLLDRGNYNLIREYHGLMNNMTTPKQTFYFKQAAEDAQSDPRSFAKRHDYMMNKMLGLEDTAKVPVTKRMKKKIASHSKNGLGSTSEDGSVPRI